MKKFRSYFEYLDDVVDVGSTTLALFYLQGSDAIIA